jgi:hypothetical protein
MILLSDIANIATIIASIIGAGALVFAGIQLKNSAQVAEGQFLLELEKMMTAHDEIHLKLRPGGAWADGASPNSPKDWAALEDYMGFFEHCELLIQDKSLSVERFNHIFGYRVFNIVANKAICKAKLQSSEFRKGLMESVCFTL